MQVRVRHRNLPLNRFNPHNVDVLRQVSQVLSAVSRRQSSGDAVQLLLHIERRSGRRYVAQLLRLMRYNVGEDTYDFEPVYEARNT